MGEARQRPVRGWGRGLQHFGPAYVNSTDLSVNIVRADPDAAARGVVTQAGREDCRSKTVDRHCVCDARLVASPERDEPAGLSTGRAAALGAVLVVVMGLALLPAAVGLRLVRPNAGQLALAAEGLGVVAVVTKVTALAVAAKERWSHPVRLANVPSD